MARAGGWGGQAIITVRQHRYGDVKTGTYSLHTRLKSSSYKGPRFLPPVDACI